MTVFMVLLGSHLKIFFSIYRVWKQDVVTALTCGVTSSLLSMMILTVLAWVLGVSVGPSVAGHQVESHGEVFLLKITTSVLSVLSLRQLDFI